MFVCFLLLLFLFYILFGGRGGERGQQKNIVKLRRNIVVGR